MASRAPTFIIDCLRTAIARGKPGGTLSGSVHPVELLSPVLSELATRHSVKSNVEDVVCGVVTPIAEQGANVGRLAALHGGFPVTTPGVQLNRMCGSGQQAVHSISQAIAAGDIDIGIAAGVEMMGTVQMGSDTDLFSNKPSEFRKNFPYKLIHQGVSAELLAEKYDVTRADCDAFAKESHRKASEAIKAGRFAPGILPVKLPNGDIFDTDEGVRYPVDEEKMASLKTIFKEGGVVTAGNASQISDAAAAVLLASESAVAQHNLKPKARVVARAVAGSDPVIMLDGVIPATELVLRKAGLKLDDIAVFEINEAFASVVLGWQKTLGVNPELVNPNGGAIAHGHPLGATGAVLMNKLVAELRRTKKRYGLQTMCIGHGMATATIIENTDLYSL